MFKKDIFKNKNFMILWIGQLVSKIGDYVLEFALAWYLYDLTGSTIALSLAIISMFLPNALVSTFSGIIADKYNRKKIIIACDSINGFLIMLLFIASLNGLLTLSTIIIINIGISIVSSFFHPSISAAIQAVLTKKELQDASALSQLQGRFAVIVGSSLAGILLKSIGINWLLLINAISFFISAFTECFVEIPENHSKINQNSSIKNNFSEIKVFLFDNKIILYLTIFAGIIANGMFMSVSLYMPAIFKDILNETSVELGIYYAIEGITAIIISILIITNQKKLEPCKWTLISLLLEGLTLLGIGLMPNLFVAYAVAILSGICFTVCSISTSVLFRTIVPNKIMGRVGSFNMFLSNLAIPIFTIIFGFLGEYINFQNIIVISSIIFFVSLIPAPLIFFNGKKNLSQDFNL